jgi:hypothetical protein
MIFMFFWYQCALSIIDIHAGQKIVLMNEMKWYKIGPRMKGQVQKIFSTLMPNFVERFNKSWQKFCSFCMDGSEHKGAKGYHCAQEALFLFLQY